MQPMRPRFATISMRTATAVSKCVLTNNGSSIVLATASCDARFALAQKAKTEGRTPLATVQRSLLAVHALFWDECTPQRPHSDVPGFTQPFDRGVLRALSGRLEQRKFALTSLTYQLLALTPSFTQITCHKKSCAGRQGCCSLLPQRY